LAKIETGLFLDDFEAEAKTHIDKVESAFLDTSNFNNDLEFMNGIFRAAHSLKGSAGFFSLKKIVAVAHELESVLSQIKDGNLAVNDEIVDVVLLSIDCLKELIDNLQDDDDINIDEVIGELKNYSAVAKAEDEHGDGETVDLEIPFDLKDIDTEKILQDAARFGHKTYFVKVFFNRKLGMLYKHPEGLIDGIMSVGSIAEVAVYKHDDSGESISIVKEPDAGFMAEKLLKILTEHDTCTVGLLITSILELDLISIAIEIDKKYICDVNKKPEPKKETADAQAKTEADTTKQKKAPEQEANFSIRLDISTINGLLDLANEMILTRNQLFSSLEDVRKSMPGVNPILNDISRLTSEIQEKVMFTRMQPISVIFNKYPRIIRDTAKALNKDIGVEIVRDDVTLDKYLLESLTDPITQIVKNSADHGLEHADVRASLGKPEKGTIVLNAYMRDGSAIIEVTDDGAGIDTEALKRKAIERGTATEESVLTMSKAEIFNIIFEPGISTAKQVTNLSGRGVGMDIVKTNIEKLGGLIEIESELGVGTTVRLKMPLTLSVIRTLIVTIDSITYAVPDLNVERIIRIWGGNSSKRIERINKSLVLSLDGRILPIVTMGEIAAKAKGLPPVNIDEVLEKIKHERVVKCLVLRAEGKSFALLIDDALETEQVLVKALPVYIQNCPCYSSVTVLGNGKAVTILDTEGTMRFMGVEDIEEEAIKKLALAPETQDDKGSNAKQAIIFNCSGAEYYAVETHEITRIDVIDPNDIQEIGRGRFVNIAGETVRVIRPEDYAPVRKRNYSEEKLYMLLLKNSVSPVGLLVRKVLDKVDDEFAFDGEQLYSDYIFGTSVFEEKILIFLNTEMIKEAVENDKVSRGVVRKGGVQ